MEQALHLLIVDCARREALAAEHASRWLLPVVTCHERLRAEPHIARWAAEQNVAAEVMGQWLGRISANPLSLDWLVVARAAHAEPAAPRGLRWLPLAGLHPDRALLDYQGWAIGRAVRTGELPAVGGPFSTLCWLDEVLAWVAALRPDDRPIAFTPYRLTAYEVVLRVDCGRRRVFFKGLSADRSVEPRVTRALFELEPSAFPRTIALEARPEGAIWWLTEECPGQPLSRVPPQGHAAEAARALARIQQHAVAQPSACCELPELNLGPALAWCAERLKDHPARCSAIARAIDAVAAANVPRTWTPLDLDPGNVLVSDASAVEPSPGRVSFIDLDDSFVGPAPLAMAVFARRCRDASLYPRYEEAWTPTLRGRIDWLSFEIAAAAVEAWLGWLRVEAKAARGELHGALDAVVATLAHRLPGSPSFLPRPSF